MTPERLARREVARERRRRRTAWTVAAGASLVLGLLLWDWIPGAAAFLLFAIWYELRPAEGPPVLSLALTFQWTQVVAGVLYFHATGRRVPELDRCDYQPMVAIGMGSVIALLVGLRLAVRPVARAAAGEDPQALPIRERTLFLIYAIATLLSGSLQFVAWQLSSITQALLAVNYLRVALLFLLFRRLLRPRPSPIAISLLLTVEIVFGFSGYFAGFREALIMAILALLEVFHPRRLSHWASLTALAGLVLLTGLLWTGIKQDVRRSFDREEQFASSTATRVERVQTLSEQWASRGAEKVASDADRMVSRLWAVYYPALALRRVPAVLPHENGAILGRAIRHILTPRVLFPEKDVLSSDSEMVRRYSGLWVASTKQRTSIAFGYAGESYIDFGVPLMFLPMLAYGLFVGLAYRWLMRRLRHRELAVTVSTAIFWVALFLFERSWIKTLGVTGTLLIVLGGATLLLDRLVLRLGRRGARAG